MVSTKSNTKGGGPRDKGSQQKAQNVKSPTIPVASDPPAGKKVSFFYIIAPVVFAPDTGLSFLLPWSNISFCSSHVAPFSVLCQRCGSLLSLRAIFLTHTQSKTKS